ncbi:ATP-binding protein [Lachnotalea sp. AF33-28]|jgi:predicted AAA+ superfamily ATPase|uniref:ATP-binding protein n=1 Tax=Lachnotalea sp. AF33-28 TaxID=2292046 RepID=UPI000E52DFE8|nr:AAA family ATPase [Lachnotalea sp. AF33-28]RHP36235.1 ATP-binding protein [Lachnotalea sp. AF33-28]
MLFERKIYSKFLAWKNETKGKKVLLVEGARRIGKSTVVEEFARNEYKSYIFIDFARASDDVKSYFHLHLNDLDTFFMLLSVNYGVQLYPRESIIIFDEVQLYPKAREAIKYLVADGRYDYIETGSLISIRENVQGIVIPSEERKIKMYPLDFEEFCWALDERPLIPYIKTCFEKKESLERNLHNKAMLLFKQYMLVGGMPMAVVAFLEGHKDFGAADLEKRDILALYRNDIMKIHAQYRAKVLAIFDQIPGLLSRHEKRVVFNRIVEGSKAEQYEETFFWLSDSMLANECRKANDPNVGLSLTETDACIKCYLGDTGLLVSHAFDENELLEDEVYKQIFAGKLGLNEGMLYENVIAQMLVANGHRLFFYTQYNDKKRRNDIEIDFIISNNSKTKYKIFPIEVKSSPQYSNASLIRFKEKYKSRIGGSYIIHPRNVMEKDDILCIPPYMTICL